MNNIKLDKLPDDIIEIMFERQKQQRNPRSYIYLSDDRARGGFNWDATEEGFEFWSDILISNNLDVFYTKYPRERAYELWD